MRFGSCVNMGAEGAHASYPRYVSFSAARVIPYVMRFGFCVNMGAALYRVKCISSQNFAASPHSPMSMVLWTPITFFSNDNLHNFYLFHHTAQQPPFHNILQYKLRYMQCIILEYQSNCHQNPEENTIP